MGGGGASGAVMFPPSISDWHGVLIAGREVNQNTGIWGQEYDNPSGTQPQLYQYADIGKADGTPVEYWDYPKNTVTRLLNDMIVASPSPSLVSYAGSPYYVGATSTPFTFSNPSAHLNDIESFFDLAHAQTTSYTNLSFSDLITQALLSVSNTTGTIAELPSAYSFTSAASSAYANIAKITDIFNSHSLAIRGQLDDVSDLIHTEIGGNLGGVMTSAATSALHALSMTAFTTLWESIVDQVNVKLSDCALPKNVNTLAILTKAAQDTNANVKSAVSLAKNIINGSLLQDVTTQFDARREITYQQQVGQFAGTMADLNAVNSTGFLWGVALLRAEQMREVSELDAQLTLQAYDKAIDTYVTLRAADLQVGLQAELANAGAHNALLQASIQLMALLKQREEITPVQVLSLWGAMYNSEVAAYTQVIDSAYRNIAATESLSLDSEKVNLTALEANKAAQDQRYLTGLAGVGDLFKNQTVFMDSLVSIREKQKTLRIMAEREYEGHELDKDIRAASWDMETMRFAADILTAPAGMAAVVPRAPSVAQQAIGFTLQAASIASGFGGGGGGK